MGILRTPDDRFRDLPDYPFAPHWTELSGGLRMHHEGPREADPVLMLHGERTWSYLYRHMIPVLADAGLRAVAPDLVGFGKSGKPGTRKDHSYQSQMDWLTEWLLARRLRRTGQPRGVAPAGGVGEALPDAVRCGRPDPRQGRPTAAGARARRVRAAARPGAGRPLRAGGRRRRDRAADPRLDGALRAPCSTYSSTRTSSSGLRSMSGTCASSAG